MSRVVMVCAQFPPVYGGAGSQAALLARELAATGSDITVVTLDQYGVGSRREEGYRVERVLRGMAAASRWTRIATTLGLSVASAWRVLRFRPSVVHIHGVFWWSILPSITAKWVKAGVVVKVTRDGQDDPATVLSKRIGPLPVGALYGSTLRRADAILVLSRSAERSAQQQGLGEKVRLFRNGVDSPALERTPARRESARRTFDLDTSARVVTFVGFLVEHKGVKDLLNAWRARGDRSTQLWLVGPHDGFYRELDDLIPGLIDRLIDDGFIVRLFGHVPSSDLPAIYWASDVFTLPSYAEGMPNSLMEAVVAGCDIVATRIDGIVDLLDDDQARLITPGDVAALAAALDAAIEGPALHHESAAAGMDMSTLARKYEALYREVHR